MQKKFVIEKKMIAQIRFYETLYVIKDNRGETIFTGSEEMAKRLIRMLGKDGSKRKLAKR